MGHALVDVMPVTLLDLMPIDTPMYMAQAWLSCLSCAVEEPETFAAYQRETGDCFMPLRAPLDQMLGSATGRDGAFVRSFVDWFNRTIWGPCDGPPVSLSADVDTTMLGWGVNMSESKTEWMQYKQCPTCRAEPGKPCEHTLFDTTKGNPVYLDEPHKRRKKTV